MTAHSHSPWALCLGGPRGLFHCLPKPGLAVRIGGCLHRRVILAHNDDTHIYQAALHSSVHEQSFRLYRWVTKAQRRLATCLSSHGYSWQKTASQTSGPALLNELLDPKHAPASSLPISFLGINRKLREFHILVFPPQGQRFSRRKGETMTLLSPRVEELESWQGQRSRAPLWKMSVGVRPLPHLPQVPLSRRNEQAWGAERELCSEAPTPERELTKSSKLGTKCLCNHLLQPLG